MLSSDLMGVARQPLDLERTACTQLECWKFGFDVSMSMLPEGDRADFFQIG
jgi:hypothetical protein